MRQDQAQWRASMTLWTLTLCLRRPRGVSTADTPYWQLSNPHSWATSQPQPRLHIMFTFLNTDIGEKKIGPSCWGWSAAEAWGWNRDMKQQQKEACKRQTLVASERPWLSVANPCSFSVWSFVTSVCVLHCFFFFLVFCNLLSLFRWNCNFHQFVVQVYKW